MRHCELVHFSLCRDAFFSFFQRASEFEADVLLLTCDVREPTTDLVGELLAKFTRPLPHRFVANNDAAGGQQLLNHTQPERKPKIQPNGVAYDLAGESIAGIAGAGGFRHTTRLLHPGALPQAGSPLS